MNAETLTILGTGFTVIGAIYAFLRNFRADMHKDFQEFKDEMHKDRQEIREEKKIARVRTDHLYEILIKLVNEKRQGEK